MVKALARRRRRYYPKRFRRRHNKFQIPVAIVAGLVPGVMRTVTHFQSGGWNGGTREIGRIYTGYDWWAGTWSPNLMWFGTFPLVIGCVVHAIAGKLGLNRAIARAGIPFFRI